MSLARRILLLVALLLPSCVFAQGGQYTNIVSSLEPLPNCLPSTGVQFQPMIWDATAQLIKVCTATNTWTAITGGGGGGNNIQINGVALSSSTIANFQNSAAFNGLTYTFTDTGFGNIKAGFTGTLGDAGITGPYSGVGSCGTHTWASTLNRNAIQTCTQPGFVDLSGSIGLGQLPAIPAFSVLGNGTGSSATPTALASIGGGGFPVFGNLNGSLLQGQIWCTDSVPSTKNCTPGIPVVNINTTGPNNVLNANRGTMGTLNNASPISMALPAPSTLPNSYFADYYNVAAGAATFLTSGGTFIEPGNLTSSIVPQGAFAILFNDGTNYWLPTMPTLSMFPTTSGTQALGYNGTTFTTVSVSGNCSGTFAPHTTCINNTGATAAPTGGAIGTQDYSPNYYGVGGGTANAQTVTLSPAPSAYAAGMDVCWDPANTNSGSATLNVNGLGALALFKWTGATVANLVVNDLLAGITACGKVNPNANAIIVSNPQTSFAPGSVTSGTVNQLGYYTGATTIGGSTGLSTDSGGDLLIETATTGSVANSPLLYIVGNYEATSGPTYLPDQWTAINAIGSGVNGTSSLIFSHSGTTGTTSINFPNLSFVTGTIKGVNATTPITLQSGIGGTAAQSLLTLQGGSVTGGSSAVKAGNVLLTGGSDASTSASSFAGSVQVEAGSSSSGGNNGIAQIVMSFVKGTTVTAGNLQCFSAAMTTADCGASPTNVIGISQGTVSASPISVVTQGEVVVNSSNAATVGHTVCAGTTAGQVTDSGGTTACTLSTGVGIVAAVSGTWTLPDGSSAAAGSTTPLILIKID